MRNAPWRIELLGALTARQGDRVITRFRSHQTGALLAYLAFHLQRTHSREEIIELLWPDADLDAGRASLRTALSSLRRQLEPPGTEAGSVLVADRSHVRLRPAAIATDVAEFEAGLQCAARSPNGAERIAALTRAVEIYRGPLLPGYYDSWVLAERERLEDAFAGALRQLVADLEREGDLFRAMDYAHRAVAVDSFCEEAHRDLIRLYLAVGRPADALRQYRELERLLRDELGEAPDAATRALVAPLIASSSAAPRPARPSSALDHAPTPPAAESPRPAPPPAPRLPRWLTRFFGREREIAALAGLLGGTTENTESTEKIETTETPSPSVSSVVNPSRLVTITGPGGSGKTRLAVEAARNLTERFDDALWFVPLVDVTDARRLPGALAEALGLERAATVEPLEQVIAFLGRRTQTGRALLLFDNFEQLTEGGAPVLLALVTRVPALTCLVTSRRQLALEGERAFPVTPLPVPGRAESPLGWTPEPLTAFAGVQLFVDRAQAACPDFQVTKRNAAAVAELCRQLEGIPLAIELAAARARVLTPAQMLDRLKQRFALLETRRNLADARHRSLWATLDWSYRLLSPEQQRFFSQLSVFRGGWTLEAAEAVCEEPRALEYLTQLRVHSLIQIEDVENEMRFRLLETLREFAGEQLSPNERAALERRHLDFFLRVAEETEPKLHGPEQKTLLERLEREHDNFRAALTWSQTKAAEGAAGLRLAGALSWFWHLRSHLVEGRDWLERTLERSSESDVTAARATALEGAGRLAFYQSAFAVARSRLEESVTLWREQQDMRSLARSRFYLALAAWGLGDHTAAHAVFSDNVALAREIGDDWILGMALWLFGCYTLEFLHDSRTAGRLLDESATLMRRVGDPWGLASPLFYLAETARRQGDYATARSLQAETLALCSAVGDRWRIAYLLRLAGEMALSNGDSDQARTLYEESLSLSQDLGDTAYAASALLGLGHVARHQGECVRARALFEESLGLFRAFENQSGIAQVFLGLGDVARREGQVERALWYFREAILLCANANDASGVICSLDAFASVAAARGQAERMARLSGAAEALREAIYAALPPRAQKELGAAIAAARAALGGEVFAAAWAEGRSMTQEQAIAYGLETAEAHAS